MLIFLMFSGMAGGVFAQQSEVPTALAKAKTVYLVDDGASRGAVSEVATELRNWGRFKLVDDAASSDITITLGKFKPFEGRPMTITDSKSRKQLWYAANKNFWGLGPDASRKVSQALVTRLRESLERKR